jgi:predicted dehydrogenase
MDRIGLGIIGCGIAAKKLHLPALRALSDRFVIVSVCNHTEPKAKEFAHMVGDVPYVLRYKDLLRRQEVEAVDIVLPIHLNYKVTQDALEAGKHVFVEKPIAGNLKDARSMLAFPNRYAQVMMVAENCRYQLVFRRAKELIDGGAIGRPYSAVWDIFLQMTSENPYARTTWRIKHKYPGGFLTDGGVHQMAVLRSLFGEILSVSAFSRRVNPSIGKLDTLCVQFETSDGVAGVLNLFYSAVGHAENHLMVFGTAGTLVIEGNSIRLKHPGKEDVVYIAADDGGYIEEFSDFYNAIRCGGRVRSSFSEGFRDLQAILGALEAAERGVRKAFRYVR